MKPERKDVTIYRFSRLLICVLIKYMIHQETNLLPIPKAKFDIDIYISSSKKSQSCSG